jgi:hypothetical protein
VRVRDNGKYMNLCETKRTDCTYTEWRSRVQKVLLPSVEAVCGKAKRELNIVI